MKIIVKSNTENLSKILSVIEEELDNYSVNIKSKFQLELVIEEIFTNICKFSYETEGDVEINYSLSQDSLEMKITFIDDGIEFNPLKKEDPDLTTSVDEREIGGLGLTLVKNNVDSIDYSYENNRNILTITKLLKTD